jgi:hypothetical protein
VRNAPFATWLLAFAILSLAGFALAGCRDDPPSRLATGVWIATPGTFAGELSPLHIHHADSGFSREVGPGALYRSVAWSPNGRYLAAVRTNQQPAVVIFDLEQDDTAYEWPLETSATLLTWSPDSLRLFALSAAEGLMLNTEGEILGFITQPVEQIYPQSIARGFWSPASEYFATVYHGYLMVVDRGGRNFFVDPALLPPMTGPGGLTVVGWDAEEVFAVFDESVPESPRRFSLQIDGAELVYVATSNFPGGTGPYSQLFQLAEKVAPGSTVALGFSSAPQYEDWLAVEQESSSASSTAIYRLRQGSLFRIADPVFPGVPPHVVAANVGVAILPPLDER